MAISYRGKDVDMESLAKKYEKNVALGNAHMNGRGDILGKGGKVVKSREEQLSEYHEGNNFSTISVNMKETVDEALNKKPIKENIKYEDITKEEKAELKKMAKVK